MVGSADQHDLKQGMRSAFWSMALFSFAIGILTLAVPLFSLQVFDRVLSARSVDTLIVLTIGAVLSIILLIGLEVVRRKLAVRVGQVIEQRLLARADGTAAGTPEPFSDLKALQTFLGSGQPFVLFDFPWAAVYAALLFAFHPLLGVVVLTGIALALGLSFLKNTAPEGRSGAAPSLPLGLPAARAMAMADRLLLRSWGAAKAGRLLSPARMDRAGAVTGLQKGCRFLVQIALVGTGAALAISGEVTIGMMVAANILGARALAPAEGLSEAWAGLADTRQAWRKLTNRSTLAFSPPPSLTPGAGGIDLSVGDLVHPDQRGRGLMFKGIGFAVAPGQQVGLTGPSGGGKTRLAEMILGLSQPRAGQIRVGGLDPSALDDRSRQALFGYLPQVPELYDGTVAENIARMDQSRLAEAQSAALLGGVHDRLAMLAEGYNTRIQGPQGLSAGELYAIQMARALLGPPRLLILDEPAAHLDAGMTASFTDMLDRLRAIGTTVILISQRRSLLRRLDKVVVLTDGTITVQAPSQGNQALATPASASTEAGSNVLPLSGGRLEGKV